jgi:hypothetical protein
MESAGLGAIGCLFLVVVVVIASLFAAGQWVLGVLAIGLLLVMIWRAVTM